MTLSYSSVPPLPIASKIFLGNLSSKHMGQWFKSLLHVLCANCSHIVEVWEKIPKEENKKCHPINLEVFFVVMN